jgi:hypothetical protein
MNKKSITRRGFAHPPLELMLGLIVLGLTIGLAGPLIKMAKLYGYSEWSTYLIVPVSFIVAIAYLFGIPSLVYRIANKYFSKEKNPDVGEWFSAVKGITWLSAFAIMITLFLLTK